MIAEDIQTDYCQRDVIDHPFCPEERTLRMYKQRGGGRGPKTLGST